MPGPPTRRPSVLAVIESCKALDRYVLKEQVYKGRVSRIFEAFDRTNGAHVALKIYKKLVLNPLQRAQLDREIEIHSGLSHEHIAQLNNVFEDDRGVYLVQEFIGGGDLFSALRASGKFDEYRAAGTVILPLLCALRYIHGMGIIHRDIKAENILVDLDGTIKLADFGFAIDIINDKRPGSRLGTWEYMAPEIHLCPFRGEKTSKGLPNATYSSGVDIWAVGILAYELLTGKPPFPNENGQITYEELMGQELMIPEGLSHDAASFIKAALCKDADLRPTARQLLKHRWLRPFQKDLIISRGVSSTLSPAPASPAPRPAAPDPSTEYNAGMVAQARLMHRRPPAKMHSLYDLAPHHPGSKTPGLLAAMHEVPKMKVDEEDEGQAAAGLGGGALGQAGSSGSSMLGSMSELIDLAARGNSAFALTACPHMSTLSAPLPLLPVLGGPRNGAQAGRGEASASSAALAAAAAKAKARRGSAVLPSQISAMYFAGGGVPQGAGAPSPDDREPGQAPAAPAAPVQPTPPGSPLHGAGASRFRRASRLSLLPTDPPSPSAGNGVRSPDAASSGSAPEGAQGSFTEGTPGTPRRLFRAAPPVAV